MYCQRHLVLEHNAPSLVELDVSQPRAPSDSPEPHSINSPISSVYGRWNNIISPPSSSLNLSQDSPLLSPPTNPAVSRQYQSTDIISPTTVPPKAAITSEWPSLSCARFTCDIYARFFLLLLKKLPFLALSKTFFCCSNNRTATAIKRSVPILRRE